MMLWEHVVQALGQLDKEQRSAQCEMRDLLRRCEGYCRSIGNHQRRYDAALQALCGELGRMAGADHQTQHTVAAVGAELTKVRPKAVQGVHPTLADLLGRVGAIQARRARFNVARIQHWLTEIWRAGHSHDGGAADRALTGLRGEMPNE
jgi:hypothetical protein